jgi:predicted transposase YbfD/YdcC
MGCQTVIAAQVVARGADYVLALKDNHEALHQRARLAFADARAAIGTALAPTDLDAARTVAKGHGCLEVRRCWAFGDPEYLRYLDPDRAWPNLRSVALVEAERRVGGTVATEARYYLSSLPPDAAALERAIRRHREVENRLHWVLDVAFREDDSRARTGHAPENLAILRHLALNLLRRDPATGSIATKRFRAALDTTYLRTILRGLGT